MIHRCGATASAINAAAQVVVRLRPSIQFNEHIEGDGDQVFAHACKLGFEGIVSKDRTRLYRSGRSKTWLKIKNPQAPGVLRFDDRDAPT